GALAIGRDRLAQVAGFTVGVGDKGGDHSAEPGGPRSPDPAAQTVAEQPRTGTDQSQTVAEQAPPAAEQPTTEAGQPKIEAEQPHTAADQSQPGAEQSKTAPEPSPGGNADPAEAHPADLPVPVQLEELRGQNDRSCVTVLFEQALARRIDVTLD